MFRGEDIIDSDHYALRMSRPVAEGLRQAPMTGDGRSSPSRSRSLPRQPSRRAKQLPTCGQS